MRRDDHLSSIAPPPPLHLALVDVATSAACARTTHQRSASSSKEEEMVDDRMRVTYVAGEFVVDTEVLDLLPPLVLLGDERLRQLLVLVGAPHLCMGHHTLLANEHTKRERGTERGK
jgi:hypothetical protein